MNKIIRFSVTVGIFMLSLTAAMQAQVTNVENFTGVGFPPTGWTTVDGPAPSWARRTTGTSPTCTPLTAPAMARFASRTAAAGTRQTISTPVIDYSARGAATPTFSLWVYRDTGAGHDSLVVYINTLNTLTGATVLGVISRNTADSLPNPEPLVSNWYNYTFSIPPGFTTDSNFIMLQGCANRGGNIFIDSLVWDAYPPVCTGTPNAGDLVLSRHLICGTGSVNLGLTAPITGAGITYQWLYASNSVGPWSSFGTSAPTQTLGPLVATTYFQCIVTCSTSGLSYSTQYDSCLVNTSPAPVLTFTPPAPAFCTGDPGVGIVVSGANSYVWRPGATLSDSTSDSVFASPLATTRYTVIGTDSIGCTVTSTINVQVQNPPVFAIVATPLDTVCEGQLCIIRAAGPGGGANTYLWSDGATTRSDSTYPMTTTMYHVTVTSTGGCVAEDSILITTLPNTIANFSYSIAGNTVTFYDSSFSALGWTWDFGDGNSSTNQNPVYTYSSPGIYSVTLTATGSLCGDGTITLDIDLTPNGIQAISNQHQIQIIPNPVSDIATINYSLAEKGELMIFDALGEMMYHTNLKSGNANAVSVDMHQYPSGLYTVQVKTSTQSSLAKLIKR